MLCLCAAQLKFWFQTDLGRENSASCYRQGRQLPLTFLTMVTRWSRSTSNFYALIGQNLTGEFMRKIMQHLETCLLWQLKLTEFCVNLWCFKLSFSSGCTKWNTVAIKSLLLFMASLSKSGRSSWLYSNVKAKSMPSEIGFPTLTSNVLISQPKTN